MLRRVPKQSRKITTKDEKQLDLISRRHLGQQTPLMFSFFPSETEHVATQDGTLESVHW
jgi:hypothetical protein